MPSFAYDAMGRRIGVSTPAPDGAGTIDVALLYDAAGRLVSRTLVGDDGDVTLTYAYDAAGRLVSRTLVGDDNDATLTYEYDAVGNVVRMVDALGTSTEYVYDALHRPVQVIFAAGLAEEAIVSYEYDAAGNLTAEVDPLGRRVEYVYDSLGRNIATIHVVGERDDGVNQETDDLTIHYEYDIAGRLIATIDVAGQRSEFVYDELGRLVTQIDPLEGATHYFYDRAGQLVGLLDAAFRTVQYEYDALGRLVRQTDALGNSTEYEYDKLGNVTLTRDALGNETTYHYDELGRLTLAIDALNGITEYVYDKLGRLVSAIDAAGNVSSRVYDALGRVTHIVDAVGAVQSFVYDAAGNLVQATDARGVVTNYVYDALSRVVEVVVAVGTADEAITQYEYDAAGNVVAVVNALGQRTEHAYDELGRHVATTRVVPGGDNLVTTFEYDARGNVIAVVDGLGHRTEYEYDALGRTISITQAVGAADEATTQYVYNDAGQLVEQIDALGRSTRFEYDALGRLARQIDALGQTVEFEYDALGRRIVVRDDQGNETLYEYDSLHRLVKQTDALGGETLYAYDAVGNLLSLTDPVGNATTWQYDALGRTVAETNELGHTRYFAYDAAGNLTEQIDRNGRVIRYAYDALGRRIAEAWYADDEATEADHTFTYQYDTLGQLTSAGDIHAQYTYVYDTHLAGRLIEITHDLAVLAEPIIVSQQFDALGRRVGLADNLGGEINYAFDALGRLTNVGLTVDSVIGPQVAFTYNAIGQTTSISRQATPTAPTIDTASTYDALGRLLNLTHTVDDGVSIETLSAYAWTYDSLNRLVSYVGPDGSLTFDYDATGQLLGVDGDREEAYEYDENGNRIMSGYVIGDNNQLLADGVFAYTYDAEGNRLTKTRLSSDPADDHLTEYTWDHRNRLIGVTIKDELGNLTATADYTYDIFDRLIVRIHQIGSQDAVETATIHDHTGRYEHGRAMDEALADFARDADTGEWSLASRYLYGQAYDQILARFDVADAETTFHLTDHQGSVRQNVDGATGDVVNEIVYDSYGNILSETNPSAGDRFKYTGREWDALVGLQYNRARWYDPLTGRWANEDPIGFLAGDVNLVRYIGNSPVVHTDPSGHEWVKLQPKDKNSHVYRATHDGDTLEDLAIMISGDKRDAAVIWPVEMVKKKEVWDNYPIAKEGARADVSNLVATDGRVLVGIHKEPGKPRDAFVDLGSAFVRQDRKGIVTFTYGDPEELESIIKKYSEEGKHPIKELILVHHWAPHWAIPEDMFVRTATVQGENSYDNARRRRGPVRGWFTRNATFRSIGCNTENIAEFMAAHILRSDATAQGTTTFLVFQRDVIDGKIQLTAWFNPDPEEMDFDENPVFDPLVHTRLLTPATLYSAEQMKTVKGTQ